MIRLVLVRHGESLWNLENRFTGWTDVDLDEEGKYQALRAGHALKAAKFSFDIVFTSYLKRAIHTAYLMMDVCEQVWVPFVKDWRLNERHYGALQGLNKSETAQKYGESQVFIWRRSYNIRPPALEARDSRNASFESRYASIPHEVIPLTESLADVVERVVPYFETEMRPLLMEGKRILIAAHGNSLRALLKYLEHISDEAIMEVEIPTGVPLVVELTDDLQFLRKYYLN
jgi:2,3-bisphosphoglycerate-dependent phosphoglycerate mutase